MRTSAQKRNQFQQLASSSPTVRADFVQQLQHTMGNQAVQQMLQTQADELNDGATDAATLRFDHEHDARLESAEEFPPSEEGPRRPPVHRPPGSGVALWPGH